MLLTTLQEEVTRTSMMSSTDCKSPNTCNDRKRDDELVVELKSKEEVPLGQLMGQERDRTVAVTRLPPGRLELFSGPN